MNITETYEKTAEKWPDKCAVHDRKGDLVYREWLEAVLKTARWLSARRHADNHRVGLYLRNNRFFLQCFAAAARLGWTAVPLDARWGGSELESKVRLSGLKIIIAEPDWTEKCAFSSVRVVSADTLQSEIAETESWEEPGNGFTDSPFYFGFTSGSTGHPKGFVRTQASWVNSFACNVLDLKWTPHDRILVAGSLFNTHFLYAAISGLYIGATVILLPHFSPECILLAIKNFASSQVAVVPTMLEALIADRLSWDGTFHWISSGAKCAAATKRDIARLFPNSLLDEYYGASELSFVSLSRQEEGAPADSVGRPFFNVSVAIRTEDGSWAEPGRTGEIFVRSPLVFSNYVTEKGTRFLSHAGEWVTVGDIGYLDAEGYLFIKGRKNGMINYGGLNIFPEEIERALHDHPGVAHAAVIGLPNRYWGEVAAVFVQVNRSEVNKKMLVHYCLERLTAYKIPRVWFLLEKMPYTAGAKIDKRRLKEKYKEAVLWKKL